MKGCRKEKERERKRNIENRIETENCLPQAAKVELLEECFFFTHKLSFGREKTNRGVRLLLENLIPILPLEKGPTTSPPPNWHAEEREKERPNLKTTCSLLT